jgi:hypothetical protein
MIAGPLSAQNDPQPELGKGEAVEIETRADWNSDGLTDLAYIATREAARELRVVTSRRFGTGAGAGASHVQVLALDPYPLADAVLTTKGNVLLVEELAGGTTAVFSTHRFRWDAKLGAMRLIGLDATLYSRTYAHDGQEASWNLLTGDLVTRTLKLPANTEGETYDKLEAKRRKKPSPPVRLERSPDGADLLGWPGGN